MSSPGYNIFVGCENGYIKGINHSNGSWNNLNDENGLDREKRILRMCWQNDEQTQIVVALADQSLLIFDLSSNTVLNTFSLDAGKGLYVGIEKHNKGFITCTENGFLKLWDDDGVEQFQRMIGDNIGCMSKNPLADCQVVTGGKDNDIKVWDIDKGQAVFKAKNVKHDWLNLQVPVWILNAKFLPEKEVVVATTGYHQTRMYDIRSHQRRPVLELNFDEYPIPGLDVHTNGHHVVVGNSRGSLALLDIRGKGHIVHHFRGAASSIRDMKVNSRLNQVASCALERFVFIHDINSKQLKHKVYLKSRPTSILFATDTGDIR